jgi:hypothetical protein
MLLELGRWLLFLFPYLLAWLLLVRFTEIHRNLRIGLAALAGGIVWSVGSFLDDYEAGFCCREYVATVRTELWTIMPGTLVFGCIGALVLVVLEIAKAKLQK